MLHVRNVAPILRPVFARELSVGRRMGVLLSVTVMLAADLRELGLSDEVAHRLALRMLVPWVQA